MNKSKSTKTRSSLQNPQQRGVESPLELNNANISSILCYGIGLSRARFGHWMDFYIDAAKSSKHISRCSSEIILIISELNHLFVGIIGPNEPCKEIRIVYIENNRYLISYKPREKGSHSVILKWGDRHLNNSPFIIEVE